MVSPESTITAGLGLAAGVGVTLEFVEAVTESEDGGATAEGLDLLQPWVNVANTKTRQRLALQLFSRHPVNGAASGTIFIQDMDLPKR